MDDDDVQQFSLRWHNHQVDTQRTVLSEPTLTWTPHYKWCNQLQRPLTPVFRMNDFICSIVGALGRMLSSGALSDVTLNANGVALKAHRLVLAACSQYFAQIFKEVEDSNAVVVIVDCEPSDLRQLLTFMYTGEVTAARKKLPSLLKLAQLLQVSGLADDANATVIPTEDEIRNDMPVQNEPAPVNVEKPIISELIKDEVPKVQASQQEKSPDIDKGLFLKNDKLSKLDQIVKNLYSSHNISSFMPAPTPTIPSLTDVPFPAVGDCDRKWRSGSTCTVCHKRLSNQYNLRVHMETHAGRRHACRACDHVSRSRDALRKHVAYRHAGRPARD